MNASNSNDQAPLDQRLNRLLRIFLTLIAGTIVTVIAGVILQRMLHILILLTASLLVAFLLDPVVERIGHGRVPRPLAIAMTYIAIFFVLTVLGTVLVTPLQGQLTGLLKIVPTLTDPRATTGPQVAIDHFLRRHGILLPNSGKTVQSQISSSFSGAATGLLGSTLALVAGTVGLVTDILLIFAIAFYLLLDGHSMHNRAVRLLPSRYRERWFFFEATFNKVLGGYVRGQLIVAATVGVAAGGGCGLLGVHYPLVIGLLAFLFELIPMLGPVLGMIPAVLIAAFQSLQLSLFVIVFFIILQQVESNIIVPRVSGHAVGLHPLAALLALVIGIDLGGIGVALLSVPIAGIAWVLLIALYGDATGQTETLTVKPRHERYTSLTRQLLERRRERRPSDPGDLSAPMPVSNERLATIKQEQEHLIEQFESAETEQNTVQNERATGDDSERGGPDDLQAPRVPVGK